MAVVYIVLREKGVKKILADEQINPRTKETQSRRCCASSTVHGRTE